jgi:putative ABC transport system permease protein
VLRALGFERIQILLAFVVESVALGLAGAGLGALLSLLTPFWDFNCINFATRQEVAFQFVPRLSDLAIGVTAGGVIGGLGGFLPALRAARISRWSAIRG